jgi:alanyl-tRNA synthetase
MTERLYYHDSRLLEFEARVLEHAGDDRHLVLDRTAFYPTSGGQPHDTGVLDGANVTDVIDEERRIVHVVDAAVPLGPVHGTVDGFRRRDYAEQHTAQHLLSALAADRLGWDTASVHFGADRSSIELATSAISDVKLRGLERWANEIVGEAREVSIGFEDATIAERTGLRKPSGRTGDIRVITIADLDRSACGGTHLSRTSEIGGVQLLGVEKLRGHVRIAFLAGGRVLAHARLSAALLATVARDMGCAVDELERLVPARQLEFKQLRERLTTLEDEIAASRLGALVHATPPDADGVRRLSHRVTDESPAMLRAMAQAVGPLERVMLVAIAPSPPTIYFATSSDSGIDAGGRLKPALVAVGGRGGGSARAAQGTAPTERALEGVAATVLGGGTNG